MEKLSFKEQTFEPKHKQLQFTLVMNASRSLIVLIFLIVNEIFLVADKHFVELILVLIHLSSFQFIEFIITQLIEVALVSVIILQGFRCERVGDLELFVPGRVGLLLALLLAAQHDLVVASLQIGERPFLGILLLVYSLVADRLLT